MNKKNPAKQHPYEISQVDFGIDSCQNKSEETGHDKYGIKKVKTE